MEEKEHVGGGEMGNGGMRSRSWSRTCSEFQTVNGERRRGAVGTGAGRCSDTSPSPDPRGL